MDLLVVVVLATGTGTAMAMVMDTEVTDTDTDTEMGMEGMDIAETELAATDWARVPSAQEEEPHHGRCRATDVRRPRSGEAPARP